MAKQVKEMELKLAKNILDTNATPESQAKLVNEIARQKQI